MEKTRRLRLQSYAWLVLNTVFWGAAFIVAKPALEHTSPHFFTFYRLVIASVIMLPFLVRQLRNKRLQKYLPRILVIEFIGNVLCLAFLYEGLARSSAIETSLLSTTVPVFIIAISLLMLKEKQTKREWIGFFISLLGVLTITLFPILSGQARFGEWSLLGNALIICANILTGFYVILAKKYYTGIPKLFATAVSFVLGMVTFGLVALFQSGSATVLLGQMSLDWQQPAVWLPVLYMAIFGSIVGLTAYIKGQEGIEASEAGLFYYLQPLVYLPLGVLVLKEQLFPLQMAGLVLIIIGVLYAQQPFARRRAT